MLYKIKKLKFKKLKNRFEGFEVEHAIFHLHCTDNNIIITVSDLKGNVLCWASSGTIGLKNNSKSTPFAFKQAMDSVIQKAIKIGVKKADVKVKGFFYTLNEIIRALNKSIPVLSIREVSPISFNGVRPRGKRRT